jgi:hypothetical protein
MNNVVKIEEVTMYRVGKQLFETLPKAVEHVENTIADHVRKALPNTLLGLKEITRVTEYLLEHRQELSKLLSYKIIDNNFSIQ